MVVLGLSLLFFDGGLALSKALFCFSKITLIWDLAHFYSLDSDHCMVGYRLAVSISDFIHFSRLEYPIRSGKIF